MVLKIGRKIYYEIATGNIILITSEMQNNVVETTVEQDIDMYTELSQRNRESFGMLQLQYGEYSEEFARCNGYRIDLQTKKILFSYPSEENPTPDPIYQPSLTEKIDGLTKQLQLMQQALDEMIINNPSREELQALNEQQSLMKQAIDELIINSI